MEQLLKSSTAEKNGRKRARVEELEQEVESDTTPRESPPAPEPNRFLVNRRKINNDSDYHAVHLTENLAEIPDIVRAESDCSYTSTSSLSNASSSLLPDPYEGASPPKFSDDEIDLLKKELSHLSFDVIVDFMNVFDSVKEILKVGRNFEKAQLVPHYVQELFLANVGTERNTGSLRASTKYRKFHFADTFKNVCSSQALVDVYYREKNQPNGVVRLGPLNTQPEVQQGQEDESTFKVDLTWLVE